MGIVNATPDSFSDGGQFADAAFGRGSRRAGWRRKARRSSTSAANSTRPGARSIWEGDEIERVAPVIRQLAAGGAAVPATRARPTS